MQGIVFDKNGGRDPEIEIYNNYMSQLHDIGLSVIDAQNTINALLDAAKQRGDFTTSEALFYLPILLDNLSIKGAETDSEKRKEMIGVVKDCVGEEKLASVLALIEAGLEPSGEV